jgi:acyl-[acyl carrier protein]--UDP-N-acetylglucosamine O-acyltransferase
LELKRLYRALFRGSNNLRAAIADAQTKFTGTASRMMLDFLTASKRGVAADVSRGTGNED